VKRCFKDKSVI